MRATIGKRFKFEAAHWLPGVKHGHKCRRTHGHTYTVELECAGEIGKETGWVRDFAELSWTWAQIKDQLDHRTLNDVVPNPTAERLAEWILGNLREPFREGDFLEVTAVTVWEGDGSWARVTR